MALWRSRVRAPSGPLLSCRQSEWYRGTPFVSGFERGSLLLADNTLSVLIRVEGMRELIIRTPRGDIYNQASGPEDGPLVLGLHGWSQRNGWHTWEPLLKPLGSAGFLAVSIDMPGWGNSAPWSSGALTLEDGVDVVMTILESLKKPSASIMGKSWGGGIALAAALAHPARVNRLILSAPAFRDLERLPQVEQPTLLVWAEDDPVIPFQFGSTFAKALPAAQLVSYPTGGHNAGPANAEHFAPIAVAFLQGRLTNDEINTRTEPTDKE
jgi:pimeloyl-ACP methyl ester carboxylesterase